MEIENQLRREFDDYDDWDDAAKAMARELFASAQAVSLTGEFELTEDTVTRGEA